MNRLCFVALHARNIEASVRFYRDLLGVPLHPDEEDTHYECSWKDPYFHFAIFPMGYGEKMYQAEIGFCVNDIEGLHKKLVSSGVKAKTSPEDHPLGRSATYYDPDGNLVSITTLKTS